MCCWDSEGHSYSRWNLWPYLGMRGLLTTPRDVTRTQILILYSQEVWKTRETFLVITCCCRNRCPNTSPKFFVIKVCVQTELPNYLIVYCFTYHHNTLNQVLLLSPFNRLQWIKYSSLQEMWMDSWISVIFCIITNRCTINTTTIHITAVCLCNVHCYMFRQFPVTITQFTANVHCYMFRQFPVTITQFTVNVLLSYTRSEYCSCWKYSTLITNWRTQR